jgi:concanavalin A-like lectin/glucanase superfamily protein
MSHLFRTDRGSRARVRRSLLVAGVAFALPLTIAAQAQAQPVAQGVVALWHMDETSGTIMNDSVGTNDGTLKNVTLGQTGFLGKAYKFNGSTSQIIVPTADALNPGSSDFTAKAHVKFSVVPPPSVGDYDIIRKGFNSTPGGDWKMEILPVSGKGVASCHFKGSSASSTLTDSSGPSLADNQWHTISCKKTSTQLRLTIDGRLLTKTVTIGTISNTEGLNIGFKDDPSNPPQDWYKGTMDEVSISKR